MFTVYFNARDDGKAASVMVYSSLPESRRGRKPVGAEAYRVMGSAGVCQRIAEEAY